jgi:uncharacterized protein YecT (DUF1311 family)
MRAVLAMGLALTMLVPDVAADESPETIAGRARARPTLEACLAKAATAEAMRACKRIVFTPCYQEEDYRQSTHGLVMCNSREGDAWDALLQSRTKDLAKRDAYRAGALTAANKAWRSWIDAECFFHREEAQGGSAEGVITTECLSDLTAERVIGLTLQLRGKLPY